MSYEFLTLEMADEIVGSVQYRQARFHDEDLATSVRVVLLNYGNGRRIAHCMTGDWSGPKSELAQSAKGLPLCPRCLKPCTEEALGWRLGLIQEKPGEDQWGMTEPSTEASPL